MKKENSKRLLEKVYVNRNGDQQVIDQLQEDGKPILIYGCANHAEVVYQYLEQNALEVEAFVVDSQYYKENYYIKNLKVRNIKDYKDTLGSYNIVIGFCDINKTKFIRNNQFMLTSRFFWIWEPQEIYRWDKAYIENNWDKLNEIYFKLGDWISQKTFVLLMDAKLNKDGSGLLEYAESSQYFNELTFCLESQNEVYVDCGAFDGDTIQKYVKFVNGEYKKIYAFEPNRQNVLKLREATRGVSNLEIIEKGTWNSNATLKFEENGSSSQIVEDKASDSFIQVTTIDEMVGDDEVTFIKMDVEGSELESLHGAINTISKNKPKLAICCYHKQNDIIEIYDFINNRFNDGGIQYKFYLRHHSNSAYETVLYAIPVKG